MTGTGEASFLLWIVRLFPAVVRNLALKRPKVEMTARIDALGQVEVWLHNKSAIEGFVNSVNLFFEGGAEAKWTESVGTSEFYGKLGAFGQTRVYFQVPLDDPALPSAGKIRDYPIHCRVDIAHRPRRSALEEPVKPVESDAVFNVPRNVQRFGILGSD